MLCHHRLQNAECAKGQCTASVCKPSPLEREPEMALSAPNFAAATSVQDPNDDVRAVAAEALIPISGPLASASAELLVQLRQQLWGHAAGGGGPQPLHRSATHLGVAAAHGCPIAPLAMRFPFKDRSLFPGQPHTFQEMQRMLPFSFLH